VGTILGAVVRRRVLIGRRGNEYFWEEADETERLPVEPDAMFTLRFTDRPADCQLAHFFYEATDPAADSPLPCYLDHSEVIFDPVWALPDRTMHALSDAENAPRSPTQG
jgi:hypothetical protein